MVNEKSTSSLNWNDLSIFNSAVQVQSSGRITFARIVKSKVRCKMNLRKYPLDKQTCEILFESFYYTTDTMNVVMTQNPVWGDDVEDSSFHLLSSSVILRNNSYGSDRLYPQCGVRLQFQRKFEFHLYQVRASPLPFCFIHKKNAYQV